MPTPDSTPAPDNIEKRDGRLVITSEGTTLSGDDIRELRLADQR